MSAASMQGASRESFAAARETLATVVRSGDTADADLSALSDDLFRLAGLVDAEGPLRRALTDPARSGEDRAALARAVVGERVGGEGLDILVWAVRARWSVPRDLADALELLAVDARVAAADQAGRLDTVEDELFRIGRVVSANPDLRTALSDASAPVASRVALVEGLLDGRVAGETQALVRQAVLAPRGRTLERIMTEYGRVAAQRRDELVATVTASVPLTGEQRTRLGAALARIYDHDVHLNIDVDPTIVGGIRVAIGDEVIDGSVVARLDDARRRLVGRQ